MPDIIEGVYVTRPELDGNLRRTQDAEQRALDAERDARRREWEVGILRYLCIVLIWAAGMVLMVFIFGGG